MSEDDSFERVRTKFFWRRMVRLPCGQVVEIAALLRETDWRPLEAPWWREKQSSIIGVDLGGNFFLRHCDGSVRYWDHRSQMSAVISPSVRAFAQSITEGEGNAT